MSLRKAVFIVLICAGYAYVAFWFAYFIRAIALAAANYITKAPASLHARRCYVLTTRHMRRLLSTPCGRLISNRSMIAQMPNSLLGMDLPRFWTLHL
jgi:hypothetical protein